MNAPMIRRLIVKDWYLCRGPIIMLAVAGIGAVALIFARREVTGYIGLTSSLISVILLSNILPTLTIVNERKRQHLPFVMSLPISPADYTAAKMIANLSAFFVVWAAVAGAMFTIFVRSDVFGGLAPVIAIAALAPFIAFSAITAVALISESEQWAIITMAATNISYSFGGFFIARLPEIRATLGSPTAIWTDTALAIIGVEVALIVLAIAAAFFFQSRKTNFI